MKIKDTDRLPITDAARELGVSLSTLKLWIKNGYPRRVKVLDSERVHSNHFVSRRQVRKLIREREQKGK
jgi:predicted site-specific integrase-resolvase